MSRLKNKKNLDKKILNQNWFRIITSISLHSTIMLFQKFSLDKQTINQTKGIGFVNELNNF